MCRILVADDDAAQLELRCRLLEAGGHEVSAAFSASEALRLVADAEMVITDLRLPGVAEGLALIRGIRALSPRIPIVVLTGWEQDLDQRPETAMVSRVLRKPVGLDLLLQTIDEVL